MLAGGDEDLLAGNLVAAVALRHGLGAQQAEIGAAMGLGQVHRAGPGAFDHLRQIGGLLLVRAVNEDRGDRALRQTRIHDQRHVGRRHVFADGGGAHRAGPVRRIPPARRKADPAALAIEVIGLLETLRRLHGRVVVAHAAFKVARKVVGGNSTSSATFAASPSNCLHHVARQRRRSRAGCCDRS
jgi:hypothetical protein